MSASTLVWEGRLHCETHPDVALVHLRGQTQRYCVACILEDYPDLVRAALAWEAAETLATQPGLHRDVLNLLQEAADSANEEWRQLTETPAPPGSRTG